jgi:hypothetical protein
MKYDKYVQIKIDMDLFIYAKSKMFKEKQTMQSYLTKCLEEYAYGKAKSKGKAKKATRSISE